MDRDDLTRESRLRLHDIRNHLQVVSSVRALKEVTRERLHGLFERAVRLVQEGDQAAAMVLLEEVRAELSAYLERDGSLQRAYDRIVAIVLSSDDALHHEVLSLGELVRSEVSYYHDDLKRLPADRVVFTQVSDAYVRADRTLLLRVVGNLLTNAAEALEEDGDIEVVVDIHGLGEPRAGLLGDIPPGVYATITVRDGGHGVSADDVRKIFEAGYSTKEGESRGLGMTVISRAVARSGGNLEVSPLEPRGTLVRVYLPAVEPAAARRLASTTAGEQPTLH